MLLIAVACVLSHFMRPTGCPVGLSGLTSVADDRYYAVDDRGGRLCELSIALDASGRVRSFATNRCVRLSGRVDLEGCAWDSLEKRIWVSDESDSSVRQFDPMTGAETAVAPVPEVFLREAVPNRSIEALAISPDGLWMYIANEDTLRCDGAVATAKAGGIVRIQEFVRAGAGTSWTPARQFRYRTHRIRGDGRLAFGGVSALAVEERGASLLVLERQISPGKLPVPTFYTRVVRVRLPSAGASSRDGEELSRQTLWKQDTGFANYEGLSRGPSLADGTRTWLLVSDAGGGAEASVLVLGFVSTDAARSPTRRLTRSGTP